MKTETAFSSIDLVGQCLTDKKRTLIFEQAIQKFTKDKNVIDAGTGSSVLAMMAAKYGASKVFGVELDPYVAEVARNNVNANNLSSRIDILEKDIRKIEKKDVLVDIDVVIMEMITTGMIDESQVEAIESLKKNGVTNEHTIYIPAYQKSFLTFGFSSFELYGLKFPMVTHLWDIHVSREEYFDPRSNKLAYDVYSFTKDHRSSVDIVISTVIEKKCKINSILLESKSVMPDESEIGETSAINGKVLVPVKELDFEAHQKVSGRLKYIYGKGFKGLSFEWLI